MTEPESANAGRDQTPVVFASYEMGLPEALAKIICARVGRTHGGKGVSVHALQGYLLNGVAARNSWDVLVYDVDAEIAWLKERQARVFLIYEPALDVDGLTAAVGRIYSGFDRPGMLFVDYVQLVPPPRGRFENRHDAVTEVCKRLKAFAVETNSVVVAAAKLNREGVRGSVMPAGTFESLGVQEALRRRRPQVHQLRESDGIGQLADQVIGIQNSMGEYVDSLPPEEQRAKRGDSGPLCVTTLKSRFGSPVSAELKFFGKSGAILDPADAAVFDVSS